MEMLQFILNNKDYLEYTKDVYYTTNEQGKIQADLEFGTYDVIEVEAPDGYKLPSNPTTKVTITKATPETINITNEKKTCLLYTSPSPREKDWYCNSLSLY